MGENLFDVFAARRLTMVVKQLRERGINDERVLKAMAEVPRHEFVTSSRMAQAYEDQPIEIEAGQTISQPYIVAAMLQALRLRAEDRALEIGTGSGYQTALLARLVAAVFTVERHQVLSEAARERLARLGYSNVVFAVGDGSQGLPEHAPFDAIIVSAATPHIPESLTSQLAEGGRMVLPVGSIDTQQLQLVLKVKDEVSIQALDGCRFVPLIGREGFPA
jgi:protein-L-isoaspartate(D-aspartate) O-methyltransferase